MNKNQETVKNALEEVYDPDLPVIDIYNLGLIYNIEVDEENKYIHILMTLTTPACPSADLIINMATQAVQDEFPDFDIDVELTFEPMWSPEMIKDEDLKRMFE